MIVELIITTEARHDLAEAYDWYESRRIGLGEEFLYCVEACFERYDALPSFILNYLKNIAGPCLEGFPIRFSMISTGIK